MDIEKFWPAGAKDNTIELLSHKYCSDGISLDLDGLLKDPLSGKIALVSSFGTEAAMLLHMVAQTKSEIDILFLNTQKHFPQTLEYLETLQTKLGLKTLKILEPDPKLIAQEDPKGNLHETNPNMCCTIRKSFALQDALVDYDGWITGRKRYQGGERANLAFIEREGKHLKINPLIHFTPEMIKWYFEKHTLPKHPLVAKGYSSVGCIPCTQPTKDGDDPRSGRWVGIDKVECGIHLSPGGSISRT
ncbi:MAG: phosphoadenylyl-sulfate reductase [Nitratireductor sp.]